MAGEKALPLRQNSVVHDIIDHACIALVRRMHQAASAAEAAANLTNPAWCGLVVFPESFFEGTLGEQLYSGYCISRKTKVDELLRVYFNTPIGFTEMPEFLLRLHVALEPFSISIGELIIEDTPECVIIRRSDYRHGMHSDAP